MKNSFICLISIIILASCSQNEGNALNTAKTCTIAMEDEPSSFDPRLIRNSCSVNIVHLLSEGLFRFDEKGNLVPALAEKMEVDESGKIYTFTLRNARWSNGDPITAKDFENTIKSIMDPLTPSPHANQLYMIKGAKLVKEGRIPIDDLGVIALDDKTLVIELDAPTSYFQTLTATHFLYPVHKTNLALNQAVTPITSGPFALESYSPSNEIVLKKNAEFWDATHVKLEEIKLLPLNDQLALQMFDNNEIDWVGSPIGRLPPDMIPKLMESNRLELGDALGTFWLRVNTQSPVLSARETRKILFNSIDREEIVKHVTQGGQKPAFTIVPPVLYGEDAYPKEIEKSSQILQKIEPITLIYIHNERNHKIAQYLEQKWKETLKLPLILEAQESKTFYERIAKGQFELSIGSWFADIPDAVNFLEVFKYRDTSTNGTGWENQEFIALLNMAATETDSKKRIDLLKQSERILMEDYPVIPLYFAVFNWVSNPKVKGVIVSPLGFFDFRNATKE